MPLATVGLSVSIFQTLLRFSAHLRMRIPTLVLSSIFIFLFFVFFINKIALSKSKFEYGVLFSDLSNVSTTVCHEFGVTM